MKAESYQATGNIYRGKSHQHAYYIAIPIGEGRYDQEKKYPIKSNQKMRYKENNSKRNTNKYIKFNNKSLTLKNIPPPDLKSN